MISKKKSIALIIVLAYLVFMTFWAIMIHDDKIIRVDDLSGVSLAAESDHIMSTIDEASYEDERIYVRGWIMQRGVTPTQINVSVALKGENSNNYIIVPTKSVERTDVTEYFDDGTNYDRSGFMAMINPQIYKTLLNDDYYEIYIVYNTDLIYRLVKTGKVVEKNVS